jgi:hypothetical protein
MGAVGAAFRTPLAVVGLVLATAYGLGLVLFWMAVAVLWAVVAVPLGFLGASMSGTRRGVKPFDRFATRCRNDVLNWRRSVADSFGFHPDLVRWWVTGSA